MTVSLPLADILQDMLCCLGSGLLVAALHDAARFLLGASRFVLFWLDVSAFALAAILECSFAAYGSVSGVPRWYMTAGLVCGAAAYLTVLTPASRLLGAWLGWLVHIPAVLLQVLLFAPVRRGFLSFWETLRQNKQKKSRRKSRKRLQRQQRMLYNSR